MLYDLAYMWNLKKLNTEKQRKDGGAGMGDGDQKV